MIIQPYQLVQDLSTQCNSTYYMMDHLIEQRWPITVVSDRYLDMKSEQWETHSF